MIYTITVFIDDDRGFVVSSELVLILTIGVIGLIVGLDSVQNAIVAELADVSAAVGSLNQGYKFNGFSVGSNILTQGSIFTDNTDTNDSAGGSGLISEGVNITAAVAEVAL